MVNPETLSNSWRKCLRWRNPESNWGHKDFQSSALPTEPDTKHQRVMNMQISLFGSLDKGTSQRILCNTSIFYEVIMDIL